MSTYADADVESRTRSGERRPVPAYGPVDALLGYALFYVVVERATPTVVTVVGDAVGDAALVRLGLALALWFVLAVTLIDQLQRQLAALGVVSGDSRRRWRLAPFETLGPYVALALAGGLVAAVTFERAIETTVALIRAVAALDVGAFATGEVVVMVAFYLAFAVATHSLDRVVIGAVRAVLGD